MDVNAEFKGTKKLDESEVSKVFGDVEIDAELVFLFDSEVVFKVEDETEMMLVEEVDFGFEVDSAFGGVQIFEIPKDLKLLFIEVHGVFPGEIATELQPFVKAHLPEEVVSDWLIKDIDDIVLLILVLDDEMDEVIHPLLNQFAIVG